MTAPLDPILIALGANLPTGDSSPAVTLTLALPALMGEGFEIVASSRQFQTPCFPPGAGPDYVNAAAHLRHPGLTDAADILAALHRVEARFGRERAQRWGMRTLDLDLLAFGQRVLPDAQVQVRWRALPPADQPNLNPDQLILPHPRLQDRAFVLVPLADVAPDWCHPLTGLSVRDMLAAIPLADRDAVTPLP